MDVLFCSGKRGSMKKFLKFIFTLSIGAAFVAGVLYFVKNVLMKDYLDDYDDDFDKDLFDDDDDDDDRDYVTLHPDAKDEDDEDAESEDEADKEA